MVSIVDICIVTRWKELESVCKIADLLAKSKCIKSRTKPPLGTKT